MADIPIPDEEARRIAEEVNRAARAAASEERKKAEALAEKRARLEEAKLGLSQLGQGAVQFSRALTDSNAGMGKYGQAIESSTDGIGNLLGTLGLFGSALGLVVKIFGTLVNQVLEQNDKIIAGYDKLADMGGAAAFNTQGLLDLADQMKYPVKNGQFEKLIEVVTEFGSNVTGLGASAGEGIINFMKIIEVEPQVRGEFNRLGITQQKLSQLQASYLATEIKIGKGRKRTTDELRADSLRYVTNLVELSALTGEKIDSIKKAREDDLKDVGYNIALQEIASKENGIAVKERIEKGVSLAGEVDATSRKAIRELIATNYQTIGPAAQALSNRFSAAGMDFVATIKDYNENRIDEDELRRRMQVAIKAVNTEYNFNMKTGAEEMARLTGVTAESQAFLSKDLRKGTADQVKEDVNNAKSREDALKQGQTKMQDASTALALAFDEFLKLIRGPVMVAFEGLMTAFKGLSLGILSFISKFSDYAEKLGFNIKAADKTLPYMFDTVENLAKEEKRINAEMLAIEKEHAKKGYKQPGVSDLSKIKNPAVLYDEFKYRNLEIEKEGVSAQLKKLLNTDNYKKELENRERQLNEQQIKGTSAEQAKEEKDKARQQPTAKPAEPKISVTGTPSNDEIKITVESGKETPQDSKPAQKFMRGGIAQNPNEAKNVLSSIKGNASIPLPSGIKVPADVSLSEDFLQKLNLGNKSQDKEIFNLLEESFSNFKIDNASSNFSLGVENALKKSKKIDNFSETTDVSLLLQNAMKDMKIDSLPADFSFGSNDILKDSGKFDNIMTGYTDTLKTNLDNIFKIPDVQTTQKDSNTNEILSVLVNKMDILATKMKENADVQYDALLRSKR